MSSKMTSTKWGEYANRRLILLPFKSHLVTVLTMSEHDQCKQEVHLDNASHTEGLYLRSEERRVGNIV